MQARAPPQHGTGCRRPAPPAAPTPNSSPPASQPCRRPACLRQRNLHCLVVVAVHDGLLVHDGASHVAPLPNVQERAPHVGLIRRVVERLQAAQPHLSRHVVPLAGRVRQGHLADCCNVLRAGAAAAANAVHQALLACRAATTIAHARVNICARAQPAALADQRQQPQTHSTPPPALPHRPSERSQKGRISSAISGPFWSYPPMALGRPALG